MQKLSYFFGLFLLIIGSEAHGKMKFREIAKSQHASINTVQSRYRYGLEKLRSLLNGEV